MSTPAEAPNDDDAITGSWGAGPASWSILVHGGEGAERFAGSCGFERADERSMITEASRQKLSEARLKKATESWAGGTVGGRVLDDRARRSDDPRLRRQSRGRQNA